LVLVVLAVVPPPLKPRQRKPWLAGLDEESRERLGRRIQIGLGVGMIIALLLLLVLHP
jgi:hypothetical protein